MQRPHCENKPRELLERLGEHDVNWIILVE